MWPHLRNIFDGQSARVMPVLGLFSSKKQISKFNIFCKFVTKYWGVLSLFGNLPQPEKQFDRNSKFEILVHISRFPRQRTEIGDGRRVSTTGPRGSFKRWPGGSNVVGGRNQRSAPAGSNSPSRDKQRFSPPHFPVCARRRKMKALAAAFVVLGMFLVGGEATPHAPNTRHKLYEPHRGSWAQVREHLRRREAFQRTLRMPEAGFVKLADLLRATLEKNEQFGRWNIESGYTACTRASLVLPTRGHKGVGAAFPCMLT